MATEYSLKVVLMRSTTVSFKRLNSKSSSTHMEELDILPVEFLPWTLM